MPELAAQGVPRDLRQRAGELDAGGAGADHHEGEPRQAARRVGLALGALEREQDAAADLQRVVEGLQGRRKRRPSVVTEVVVDRAGGDDQLVVGKLAAVLQGHRAPRRVHASRLAHQDGDVALPGEDVPDGPRDLGGGKPGGRDLVEQRGEQVMIGAIDHRQLERRLAQGLGSPQAAETAAQDDHARGRHAAMIQVVTEFTGGTVFHFAGCGVKWPGTPPQRTSR